MDKNERPLKVLVTGAAGFLGSNLVDFLLQKGHSVIGLDNFQSGSSKNLQHLSNHPRFEFFNHNIYCSLPALEGLDQIYNLACPASPVHYQKDPISTLNTCFLGTRNLLELARSSSIRILHTSTSEVYGDPSVHPQTEHYWGNVNSFGPRACYDEGKRVAEALCYAYREQHDIDIRIARIFNTYGPRMGASDGRVVSSFIASALAGEDLKITGDGTATRSFQFVTDCMQGLYTLMNSGYSKGPVNIGNDGEFTIERLAELVIDLVSRMTCQPRVSISHLPPLVDDPAVRRPDIALAREVLNWQPVVQLEEGLRRTIEWHINESRSD
ncbi:UDP-glucuronate 5-epimerase [Penicillium canescens]|uniref:UDP-glucuronic acid decarboxylase 1 n=1 Tax=Penicillium canescens TaxID=5083 RepID=A0AAD6NDX5_PENCN|nr:UDP-glucuronate 5-epimerase [Penicillium canescens]KAJ6049880.1 UDP-glucuronate 5-epimerase [Penicillium canescens]KAJ6052152.1 UDP-glucuronate 5-epimerase [Penicillium canescens]KAJ6062673.1 UDP-glucuronate 5-epimerase [Penicillium canescens]KAJ6069647.1 UDP-glucuronate 5-epimerase [Penicillium canescens]KAJ6182301.1 UDP-glucuronate 5-epimerase [Penicillium canescens]